MKILVLAQYFKTDSDKWIDNFCEDNNYQFIKVAYPYNNLSWHARGAVTPYQEWLMLFRYVYRAFKRDFDCVVTSFPQLALVASVLATITHRKDIKIVALNFNIGSVNNKFKGFLSGILLRRVAKFAVHATEEIDEYSRWMRIPKNRFIYVPLQRGLVRTKEPAITLPAVYIAAMGSANRDYDTLLKAHEGLGVPLVIVAKKQILDNIPDRHGLIKLTGLTLQECNYIMARAVLNVVPLQKTRTAAGQVTFVTSMRLGRPTIVTRCVGSVDYIEDGVRGILVDPGDHGMMREKMVYLLENDGARNRIATAAKVFSEENLSDEAAAKNLINLLRPVEVKG